MVVISENRLFLARRCISFQGENPNTNHCFGSRKPEYYRFPNTPLEARHPSAAD
jgi:hypothetical protein